MPELGSLGSVRGAPSNERPYREHTESHSVRASGLLIECDLPQCRRAGTAAVGTQEMKWRMVLPGRAIAAPAPDP